MDEEILTVELNSEAYQESIDEILDALRDIQKTTEQIGKNICKALILLKKELKNTENSINSMVIALEKVTGALENFMNKLAETQQADQWAQGIKDAVDIVLGVIGTIAAVAGTLLAAEVSAPVVAIVALVMAVVSAVGAAVLAIIKHWDEISMAFTTFFTETLPQLWAQFTQWVSGIAEWAAGLAVTVSAAAADCWERLQQIWNTAAAWFRSNVTEPIGETFSSLWSQVCIWIEGAWQRIQPILGALKEGFQNAFGFIGQMAKEGAGVVTDALSGITTFLSNVFSGNWDAAWQQLKISLKSAVNGVIGLLNAMLSRFASALNKVIGVANTLSFTVPQWVPGIGGKHFGVNMRYVSTPQIPYLAQGAVLPANKPFLAVVGDQRHGTNVEAPLATIQEAVALVMHDQISAMMAGFQALLEEQRATRTAVESICVGDDAIAAAVDRHRVRMAMMRGF